MALPAGRYGVTKNQLLKIKKLPMNTIKLIEELTEKFNLLGAAAFKNSTSVVTESSDLVESGAVKDIVGWGNKNLFDVNTALTGYIDAGGEFVSYSAFRASDYLPIKAGETYTLSYNRFAADIGTGMRIAWYQADKTFIKRDGITETTSLGRKSTSAVAPENAVYVRISNPYRDSIENNSIDIQFELGSTATAYEPYHASVADSLTDKCDNSVIGTVEDGANPTKSYAVGEHFIRNGKFCTVTVAVTTSSTWTLGSNYVEGTIAENLVKQATFSGTTSVGGNIALDNTRKILSAFVTDANKTYIALPYINGYSGENAIHIVQANAQSAVVAEESVSGIYYYI